MTVSFLEVPSGTRVPRVYVEFDPSEAQQGPSLVPHRGLLIAQRLTSGSVAAGVPTAIGSASDAATKWGVGSYMHLMAKRWFESNQVDELWGVGVDDHASGVAATAAFAFSGTATAAGTVHLYVAGVYVPVAVASGDSAATVATAVTTAVTAAADMPVTVTDTTGTNTFTAKNKGTVAHEMEVRANYLDGQVLPAGITLASTVVQFTGGATDPDISGLWALLGDEWFTVWAIAQNDSAAIISAEAELASRSSASRMIDAVMYYGKRDSHAALVTAGAARNSEHGVLIGATSSPSPPFEWAASLAAISIREAGKDPARPIQRIVLPNIRAPKPTSVFTQTERETLLNNGVATFLVTRDNLVQIERSITTYQTNSAGADDTAWLDVETRYSAQFVRYDVRNQTLLRYPRHKLAGDGNEFAAGQAIVTPSSFKAFLVTLARGWVGLGIIEGLEQFKRDLVVEINASDPNRLDVVMPPDFVNQFRVGGFAIRFRL